MYKEIIEKCMSACETLPNKLTKQNIPQFLSAINNINNAIKDPELYLLLMPFHHLTWSWENAYADGFTWERFLNDIVESGNTQVIFCETNLENRHLGNVLKFSNEIRENFCIAIVHDD